MANATVPYRSTTRPLTRPSVDDLEHYLTDHTIDQASRHWKVHPRTIHKWRARVDAPQATVLGQDQRNTFSPIENTPTFSATADDVAGDHSMWRDPWTGELMPVPPGAHRKVWEAERIAARDRHKAAVQAALAPVPPPEALCPAVDTMSTQEYEITLKLTEVDAADVDANAPSVPYRHSVPSPNIALQSLETTILGIPTGAAAYVPSSPAPAFVRERVVERVVYRVPVDRRDSPVLEWAQAHMPLTQLLIAIAITMLLIGVANLG